LLGNVPRPRLGLTGGSFLIPHPIKDVYRVGWSKEQEGMIKNGTRW